MIRQTCCIGMLALCMFIPASVLNAQSTAMEQYYGRGVHAFHSGQMQEALDSLSQAIRIGSRDPRVYYFRGLAQSSLGNSGAATTDFSIGAQLETTSGGRHYAVGRALERVQGPLRLQIEDARTNARTAVRLQKQFGSQGNVVQEGGLEVSPIIPDPAERGSVAPVQTNFPDVTGIQQAGTPFATETPMEEKVEVKEVDPFGTSEAIPAETINPAPGGEQTPMPGKEDPFGAPTKEPAGSEAPAKEKPAEEDPFGAPPEEMPAEEPAEADPFGGEAEEMPAEKPAEEDPFGGEAEDPFAPESSDPPKEPSEGGEEKSDEGADKKGADKKEGEKSPPDDPFGTP